MKIVLNEIPIREVVKNYVDNAEEGVIGYDGKLNIRPKYQREFIYDNKRRDAVIDTIRKGFPLNVVYWAVNKDGTLEVMDGQQRIISFCKYVNGDFSIDADGHSKTFHNLTETEKDQILNYKLMVYFCEGNDKEKLDWFNIINIAGMKLTAQEMRNATYTGTWLTAAKTIFSKPNCVASKLASDYIDGSAIRQDYLEAAIKWISNNNIEIYMSRHQQDPDADELWNYFKDVIEWIENVFATRRKEMKYVYWGELYNKFKSEPLDPVKLEQEIQTLMMDDDVTNKKGIYPYVLTHDERYLNIRAFTDSQKREAYENRNGICPICGKHFELEEMEADHITPWADNGKTIIENCQMLCRECNRRKSSK
jgi:arsenate reductase-like glutaredoxin family protein